MIDINLVRENPDLVKESIQRRGLDLDLDKLLQLDKTRNVLVQNTDKLRSNLKIEGKPNDDQLAKLQSTKKELETLSKELDVINKEFYDLLAQVPNLIADGTPDGGEENNAELRASEKVELSFEAKDHMQLNEINDLFDFEAGAKVAGSKFYFQKDKLVRLWQAIQNYTQEILRTEGFELMGVPHMVNFDVATGTGYMPKGEENQNYIDKDQGFVMIATSEIPLTGYHKDEILDLTKPKLYAGISPNYRLEAGAYGKFSKGLFRTHQFDKIEMYVFCKPSDSQAWLNKIVEIEEKICKELNIPYRVVRIAAGDLSGPAFEKYDVEYYSPADKKYHELTSCSNCTDYQSRNLNIKYRNDAGKLEYAHTLNGTAVVSSRMPIAILENYQNQDGTVSIPESLRKFYGSDNL